jgi:hypothetical protein
MYRSPNTSRLASWLIACVRCASNAINTHAATVATNTKSMPATHANTTARQSHLYVIFPPGHFYYKTVSCRHRRHIFVQQVDIPYNLRDY